jgi:GNAT superfamily N-acetyltransferase
MNTVNQFKFISICKDDIEYLNQLELLFYDYYKSMEDKGLILQICENGGQLWRKSIEHALEKTHKIVISLDQDLVIGFVWGYVRLSPNYLGGKVVGVWNGLYVVPAYRNFGLSKSLYLTLEEWWKNKNVHSIEAQVLVDNMHSIKGMENMGFIKELFQTRKLF